MGPHDEVWHLHHGGRVVAALHVTESDFPWLHARVEPAEGRSQPPDKSDCRGCHA